MGELEIRCLCIWRLWKEIDERERERERGGRGGQGETRLALVFAVTALNLFMCTLLNFSLEDTRPLRFVKASHFENLSGILHGMVERLSKS